MTSADAKMATGRDTADAAPDLSVITITCNEAGNIGRLVEAIAGVLRAAGRTFEIIVVDDASHDGTPDIVRAAAAKIPEIRLLERRDERGIGSAYLHGIRASRGCHVATMDADFSHPPERLPDLLTIAATGALALGSRFLRAGDFVSLWYRNGVTRGINLWHRFFLGTGLHDHPNGFMAIRRDLLEQMLAEGDRIGFAPFTRILYVLPLVVMAGRLDIPIRETPARYIFRTEGETKIRFWRGVGLLLEEWRDSILLKPLTRRSR